MSSKHRIINNAILLLITLIFLGSFILIVMNMSEDSGRKDSSIVTNDRDSIVSGGRAFPFISSVVPSSGFKGSTHEIVGTFYFTQLLALALDLPVEGLGLDLNMPAAAKLLEGKNLAAAPA